MIEFVLAKANFILFDMPPDKSGGISKSEAYQNLRHINNKQWEWS
jgi:hypothetical protein